MLVALAAVPVGVEVQRRRAPTPSASLPAVDPWRGPRAAARQRWPAAARSLPDPARPPAGGRSGCRESPTTHAPCRRRTRRRRRSIRRRDQAKRSSGKYCGCCTGCDSPSKSASSRKRTCATYSARDASSSQTSNARRDVVPLLEHPRRQVLEVERQQRVRRTSRTAAGNGQHHVAAERPQLLPRVGEAMRPVGAPDRDDERGACGRTRARRPRATAPARRRRRAVPVRARCRRRPAVRRRAGAARRGRGDRARPAPMRTMGRPPDRRSNSRASAVPGRGSVPREQRVELRACRRHQIVFPPSTTRLAPVTNAAASEHR